MLKFLIGVFLLLAIGYAITGSVSALPAILSDTPTPTSLPGNLDDVVIVEDGKTYVIRQLIPRDGIEPIYNPQFISAADSELVDDELVMGVEINGDARAYPVGVLRSREMVNDEIGGTPVLVTW